jgi:hypothetical protein
MNKPRIRRCITPAGNGWQCADRCIAGGFAHTPLQAWQNWDRLRRQFFPDITPRYGSSDWWLDDMGDHP